MTKHAYFALLASVGTSFVPFEVLVCCYGLNMDVPRAQVLVPRVSADGTILLRFIFTCTLVWYVYMQCVCRCLEARRTPRAGVIDSYELSCGWWGLNLGPLEEQPWLLSAELSFRTILLLFVELWKPQEVLLSWGK